MILSMVVPKSRELMLRRVGHGPPAHVSDRHRWATGLRLRFQAPGPFLANPTALTPALTGLDPLATVHKKGHMRIHSPVPICQLQTAVKPDGGLSPKKTQT